MKKTTQKKKPLPPFAQKMIGIVEPKYGLSMAFAEKMDAEAAALREDYMQPGYFIRAKNYKALKKAVAVLLE